MELGFLPNWIDFMEYLCSGADFPPQSGVLMRFLSGKDKHDEPEEGYPLLFHLSTTYGVDIHRKNLLCVTSLRISLENSDFRSRESSASAVVAIGESLLLLVAFVELRH
jgi:hypothetical protein